MNYIDMFMGENNLTIGESFAVCGSIKYSKTDKIFYVDNHYTLRDIY